MVYNSTFDATEDMTGNYYGPTVPVGQDYELTPFEGKI
jgi:hypothetical protein